MGDKHLTDEEINTMFNTAVANADALRLIMVDMWERWKAGEMSENQRKLALVFLGGRQASRVTTMIVAEDVDSQSELEELLGPRLLSIFSRVEGLVAEGSSYTAALLQECTEEVDG